MCYRMVDKRTEAMHRGVESQSMTAEKARIASAPVATAASPQTEEQAYSTFRARLQRWMVKKGETESTS